MHVQLRHCEEASLVKMGTVAMEGTKVKANASNYKAKKYVRMPVAALNLRTDIRNLTQATRDQDRIDDDTFGPDCRGAIHAAKKRVALVPSKLLACRTAERVCFGSSR
jgi:hypothetical protein